MDRWPMIRLTQLLLSVILLTVAVSGVHAQTSELGKVEFATAASRHSIPSGTKKRSKPFANLPKSSRIS
jgi:hypothetical protein